MDETKASKPPVRSVLYAETEEGIKVLFQGTWRGGDFEKIKRKLSKELRLHNQKLRREEDARREESEGKRS